MRSTIKTALTMLTVIMAISAILAVTSCDHQSDGVLFSNTTYTLFADSLVQGDTCITADRILDGARPESMRYTSPQKIIDALFTRALNRADSDSCIAGYPYAIWLADAILNPRETMDHLRSPECQRDPGWGIAAWEAYCVTGDRQWLEESFTTLNNQLFDRFIPLYNDSLKLVVGATCPVEPRRPDQNPLTLISLADNATLARIAQITKLMADELEVETPPLPFDFEEMACAANERFWKPQAGYYAGMLTGQPAPIQSPVTRNFAQATAVVLGVATPDMTSSLMSHTPVLPLGIPCNYPLDSESEPYFDPLVQGWWNVAAAAAHNSRALRAGLAASVRDAAISAPGAPGSAAIKGLVLRILMGIKMSATGMSLHPAIPAAYAGTRRLAGLQYREATLNISIHGWGDRIHSFKIDGREVPSCVIPVDITPGKHNVEITMARNSFDSEEYSPVEEAALLPPMPEVTWTDMHSARLSDEMADAEYRVWLNGVEDLDLATNEYILTETATFGQVNIAAVNPATGLTSACAPTHYYIAPEITTLFTLADYTTEVVERDEAPDIVPITPNVNPTLNVEFDLERGGRYLVDVSYVTKPESLTDEKGWVVRTLLVNGHPAGLLALRSARGPISEGYSNLLSVDLQEGHNTLSITYLHPYNRTIDGTAEMALVKYLRIIKR